MPEKYTLWILLGLIAFVLFKDKLFASGGLSFAGAAGTTAPGRGPSPSGDTYASTPPGTVSPGPQAPGTGRGFWDVVDTGLRTAGSAYETYEFNH